MIRRHSTRLSQAHGDEPEEDQGHRTASHDYPELGTVLDDRPDPGRVITVVGMRRRADAYGTDEDPRNGEYNGGEGDLGMKWAEPGQQAWMEEHVGPQEEAPPPVYDPDMSPVMARLAAMEEAQAFFGARHHATTINGTQVDDAGDAPEHGTVPRAAEPNDYDGRSTEGQGDDRWNQPLPGVSKEDSNGATVGMYPEGISAGGGPGISVGPVTAGLSPQEAGELRGHIAGDHHFPVQDDYVDAALAAIHEGLHMSGRAGHEHGDDYETDPGWESRDAGGYHPFTGMRSEARVPWTGKERGTLHRWQEEPTATWGDFVNSADFPLLGPGEHVSHEDQGEGIGEVEGAWRQVPLGEFQGAFNVHVRIDGRELHGHDDDQDDAPGPPHEHDDPADSLDNPQDNPQDKNGLDNASSQVSGGLPQDSPQDNPQDKAPVNPVDPDDPMNDPANWPQTGADVSERGRAYTQGSDDGKVTRGAAPVPFSPDDGDSGGGGDQGDDSGDGDQPDDSETPFSKDAALAMFTASAGSPSFRFEFTAAWHDVVEKAKRIRAEGHVRIVHASAGMVVGEVRGDHDTYESGIQRPVGKRQTIQHWACGCPWASFHQDKAGGSRYAGRPCSHVMALQFEAQSRGMFGRSLSTDAEPASWAPESVVVKSWPPYEGEPHAGRWREEWRAPLARRSAGAASQAGAPGFGAPGDRASYVLLRAGEDPGAVGALRLLAGMRATADQANAPWGSDNVTGHPPAKPYGATSPPNRDQDPGSYGPLAAPDPENWGGIQEDSVYQMPLANTAAHQVLVPGAPHPAPGDLHWPDMNGWQQADQGTFGYTDRASTAGPSTAMDPRDPSGIRMEEARRATAAGTPFPYHGQVPQLDGALAELRGEPEPALPETTAEDPQEAGEELRQRAGIDGTMGDAQDVPHRFTASAPSHDYCILCGGSREARAHVAAADGTIGGGSAGTGMGQGAADDEASLGEFGASSSMGDLARETWPQAQQPSPVGQEPGMGSTDDTLSPGDPSIQTIGNQQWSGGGADSDEVAVPAGQSQGGIDDIVASFQMSAAAKSYSGGSGPEPSGGDIAAAARQYLAKTAEALPDAEAQELIREGAGSRARNLDLLRLEGTHYEDEDDELGKKGISLDGYDDDVIFA